MPLAFNLTLLLYAWFVLLILQLAVGPLLVSWFTRLADRGWALGRLVGWLGISLLIWNLSHLNIPANTQLGIWLAFLSVIFSASFFNFKRRQEFKRWFRSMWPILLLEEVLFFASFIGFGLIRSFNPNMLDLEKFMDGGFIASYLRSPTLPMEDMWLAGFKVNYYTFGHFMGAVLTRIWAVDVSYSYNLLLAVIFGLTVSGGFSLVFNLINFRQPRFHFSGVVGALLGSALLVFGGNSHTLWYWLKHQSLTGYWYAEATRFIEFTIHEFPAYSFIVSDLHGHLWDLPLVLLFLTLVLVWYRSMTEDATSHRLTAVLGLLLGTMAMTNTWDLMIYGVFIAGLLLMLLLLARVNLTRVIFSGLWLGLFIALSMGFWYLNFDSISEGIRLVTQRSPLWQLVTLWGGHAFLGLLALFLVWKSAGKKKLALNEPIILILVPTAFFFLVIPEVVYFKDIYPSHPRANTMFKFTYQSFVMLTVVAGWLLGRLWQFRRSPWWLAKLCLAIVCTLVAGTFLLFPYSGYQSYYNQFRQASYLDGLTWMQTDLPDDYQAILWLKQNVTGRPVILEAVGESYTTFARISANSGLPTILGWRVHEWLWRNSFDLPSLRTSQVQTVYEQPLSATTAEVLAQYHIRYIIVGTKERESYLLDEPGLESLGAVVFQSGQTKIIMI